MSLRASEHAIDRYCERVIGVGIITDADMRDKIAEELILSTPEVECMYSYEVKLDGYDATAKVTNSVIITIMK